MRILVIAASAESRCAIRAALEAAEHEIAAGTTPAAVLGAARRAAADVATIEARSHAEARSILERVRGATERPLPAVLLLPMSAARLRTPTDDSNVMVIADSAVEEALAAALAELEPHVRGEARAREARLRLDLGRGTISANGRSAAVTPSEATLLDELLRKRGEVVATAHLVGAVWDGRRPLNAPAALRTHIYTLRAKLREVAPAAEIANQPRVGYSLELGSTRTLPPLGSNAMSRRREALG